MGQTNYPKGNVKTPEANIVAIGANSLGQVISKDEYGNETVLAGGDSNIIANRGLGLAADLPLINNEGDTYVTTDTFRVYVAGQTSWSSEELKEAQFITDSSTENNPMYQFINGAVVSSGYNPPKPFTFVSGDLVGGILSINHNLGNQYPSVIQVYNGADIAQIPSNYEFKGVDENNATLEPYFSVTDTCRIILNN